VFGRCEQSTGINPFDRLVDQVMTTEPYATARRVFWVVDNGSSHRGQACIDRLEDRWPTLRLIHLPVHASWLNQVEIYFSVVQRKVVSPNDFHSLSDVESRLLDFQQHYEQIATPVEMEVHQERSERATRAHRRPRSRRPHARCLTRPRMRHRNSVPDH